MELPGERFAARLLVECHVQAALYPYCLILAFSGRFHPSAVQLHLRAAFLLVAHSHLDTLAAQTRHGRTHSMLFELRTAVGVSNRVIWKIQVLSQLTDVPTEITSIVNVAKVSSSSQCPVDIDRFGLLQQLQLLLTPNFDHGIACPTAIHSNVGELGSVSSLPSHWSSALTGHTAMCLLLMASAPSLPSAVAPCSAAASSASTMSEVGAVSAARQ